MSVHVTEKENPFEIDQNTKAFVSDNKMNYQEMQDMPFEERLYQHNRRADKYGLIDKLYKDSVAIAAERDRILWKETNVFNFEGNNGAFITGVNQPEHEKSIRRSESQHPTHTAHSNKPFVKEKRESMHDYITKKRELFLANMNINIKKEETKIIKETLVNKEESLNAQQANYRADQETVKRWLRNLKEEADIRKEDASKKTDEKNKLERELAHLMTEIQKLETLKSNSLAELQNYKEYKHFVDEISKERKLPNALKAAATPNKEKVPEMNTTRDGKASFFPTQPSKGGDGHTSTKAKKKLVDAAKSVLGSEKTASQDHIQQRNPFIDIGDENFENPFGHPGELLEILDKMEEDNLSLIQNTQTAEEEYEKLLRKFKAEQVDYQRKCVSLRENREELDAKKKAFEDEVLKLESIEHQNKTGNDKHVKVTIKAKEGEIRHTQYEEIIKKINDVCSRAASELHRPDDTQSMDPVSKLKFIEKLYEQCKARREMMIKGKDADLKKLLQQKEVGLAKEKKEQKIAEMRERERLAKEEQQRKQQAKRENQSFRIHSRKVMSRAPLLHKKVVVQHEEKDDKEDDYSKYLNESQTSLVG